MQGIGTVVFVALLIALIFRWLKVSDLPVTPVRGDVLLVFAHPDDEAMFFTPLLHALKARRVTVHFLCMSNGNFGGAGKLREKELYASGAFFGVQRRNIKIVDHADLQDGMRQTWSASLIRREIDAYLQKAGSIGTMVTFDSNGVSGHTNHVAVHNGVRELKASMPPGILHLQLRTRSLPLKYIGPLAVLPYTTCSSTCVSRTTFVALIPPTAVWASMAAMQKHASQLVWFRYLFVLFSSYTYVNEIEEL